MADLRQSQSISLDRLNRTKEDGAHVFDVPGVGELSFPDSMSDEEIGKAINSHPQAYDIFKATSPVLGAGQQALKGMYGIGNVSDNMQSGMDAAMESLLGKRPGKSLSENYSRNMELSALREKNFKNNNPISSGALNIAGGAVSSLPLNAVAAGMAGPSALKQILAFGGTGAAANTADSAIEKYVSGKDNSVQDASYDAILGALGGVGGVAASRAITPFRARPLPAPTKPVGPDPSASAYDAAVQSVRPTNTAYLDKFMVQRAAGKKTAAAEAFKEESTKKAGDFVDKAAGRAPILGGSLAQMLGPVVGMAAASHLSGVGDPMTAAALAALAPMAYRGTKRLAQNRAKSTLMGPRADAALQSLISGSVQQNNNQSSWEDK